MSKKIIFSIEYNIPAEHTEYKYVSFYSNVSLSDADIIVYNPAIPITKNDIATPYNGIIHVNKNLSYKIEKYINHWKKELKNAVENGKNIFVFLNSYNKFYIYGNKSYEHNLINNYSAVPFISNYDINDVRGELIKCVDNSKIFTQYWKEFEQFSAYRCYLSKNVGHPIFTSKDDDRVIGAIKKNISTQKQGNVIFLPFLSFEGELFSQDNIWTDYAEIQGKKLIDNLIKIDKALIFQESIPIPDWCSKREYKLNDEILTETRIKVIDNKVNQLLDKKKKEEAALINIVELKQLLYGSGKTLENAIIKGLKILGFSAKNYLDSSSEFDAIFSYKNKNFLVEAEGKDNKEIDIIKCRQLSGNVDEYFEKFNMFPKGVLFGNAKRLEEPHNRGSFFTEKCRIFSEQKKLVLIKTIDFYIALKNILDNKDAEYKQICRNAILNKDYGILEFPQYKK